LIPKFKSEIEKGSTYAFENFMVAANEQSYKATQHKYRLNFMHSTKVFKISTKDIPSYHFDFMPFPSILAVTREDKLLGKYYFLSRKYEFIYMYILLWIQFLTCFLVKGHCEGN